MRDVTAGAAQPLDMFLLHRARADGIDDDADVDAAAGGTLQRVGEAVGGVAGVVDVGLERDPAAGAVDCGQHRRKDPIAVGEDLEVVAPGELRAEERCDVLGVAGLSS